MRKSLFAAIALAVGGMSLSACSDNSDTATATAPEGVPGLVVTNARLVLPPVEGNPGAVYFDMANDGDSNIAVRTVNVAGAKTTEIHAMSQVDGKMVMGVAQPVLIRSGEKASFKPGDRHVMAFDLSPDLKPGGTTEVTVIVAGGDKTSFPAEIRGAGDAR